MNSAKILSCGLLLIGSGCLTAPGDLGAVGESSEGTESQTDASTEPSGTSGEIPDTGTTGGALTGGAESGDESTGEPSDPPECELGVGVGLQRRLTSTQVENAIADLFGVSIEVVFDDDLIPFESAESLSPEDGASLVTAAAFVAGQFAVPACAGDEDACAQEFLETYVPLVLRGQVSVEALSPIYDQAGEYEAGIRAVVGAMITHPAFIDVTPTGTDAGGVLTLDANSIATRLALLAWNSVPDAALLGLGEELTQPGVVEAYVDSMLTGFRYRRAQSDLYAEMTRVQSLPSTDHSAAFDGWSASLAASMLEEQRRFVGAQVSDADASLEDLLTSSSTFINAELAGLYGGDLATPAPLGNSWAPGELNPMRRGGLLTQLGMITLGSANRSADLYPAPIYRGVSVLSAFGCAVTPPPPPGVDIVPADGPIASREDWEDLVDDPACATCHNSVDPLGFAFGDYDGVGRWDPRGDATNAAHPLVDDEFADAVELGALFASDSEVLECVAQRYYTFALRRPLEEADACAVQEYTEVFVQTGGNLRALVHSIATSNAFSLARP
jgi:hypothetical protein